MQNKLQNNNKTIGMCLDSTREVLENKTVCIRAYNSIIILGYSQSVELLNKPTKLVFMLQHLNTKFQDQVG